MRQWFLPIAAVACCLSFLDQAFAQEQFNERVIAALDSVFDTISTQESVVNAVALVEADGGRRVWCSAAGVANPQIGEEMTTEHVFRTASVTKSFTGVLIMQLIEEGKLTLDTPVHEVFPRRLVPANQTFDTIHVVNDESFGNQLTVRQLLCHTSGLADYWFDKGCVAQWDGKSWLDVMEGEVFGELAETFDPPTRLWAPEEVLEFFYEIGLNRKSHFRPGEGYLYSDTNYLLLGMIIEEITEQSLAANFRRRIYEPLSLNAIYTEYREPKTDGTKLAHHFWVLRESNLDVVAKEIASTAEWANGGQISSAKDLSDFIRGVFSNRLFKSDDTLEVMKNASPVDLTEPQKYFDNGESTYNRYSCGLKRWNVNGVEVWGHTGFWGVGMFYLPDEDISIAFATNQVATNVEKDLDRFIEALQESGAID